MGLIVDTGYSDKTGQGWSVEIEDTQAAPGVTSPNVVSKRIDTGKEGDSILEVRSKKSAEVDLVLETETQHERIVEIADGPSRRYRLDITKQGATTPRFRGFCVPSAVSTSLNEQRTHVVTVRAKDQSTALTDGWLDNGSPYTGYQDASTIVADILATLGHGLPIEVVMDWRPETMSQSDHPLGLQVPSDAFYRKDDSGVKQPQSRGDVLADIVGRFNAILRQSRKSWQIIQPEAFRSGSSVTVWEYDTSGTYQQQTTRPATVDITTYAYRLGSDEVDAVEKEREALVTYEHGAPNELEFNGSFEDGISTNWTWTGANSEYTNGNFHYDGDFSADIKGEKVDDPALQKATATDYTGADLGAASPSEPFEVVLRYVARATTPSSVSSYGVFWALKLAGNDGNDYWWDGSSWTQNSTPIKSAAASSYDPITDSQYDTSRHDISPPPEPGDVELRLYEPVASPTGSYDIFVTWDAIEYNRQSEVGSVTTDQQFETSYDEGGTYQTTHRIGDGPWKGSQGTLRDDTGTDTYGWGVSGVGGYPLGRLHSRQIAKMLGAAQQRIDLRIDRGQVPPDLATVAVEIGGTRYWPVRTKLDGPDGGMEVTLVRLLDVGLSSWTHDVIPGDASGGGSAAGVGAGGQSLNWDTLPGKPDGLLAEGGDSDGYSETQSLDLTKSDLSLLVEYPVSATIPNQPPTGALMLQLPFFAPFDLEEAIVYADTAPANNYTVTLDVAGTTVNVTLPAGQNLSQSTLTESVSALDVLRVTTPSTQDPDIRDLTIALDLTAT